MENLYRNEQVIKLQENLIDELLGMGLNPEFVKNPAFKIILNNIKFALDDSDFKNNYCTVKKGVEGINKIIGVNYSSSKPKDGIYESEKEYVIIVEPNRIRIIRDSYKKYSNNSNEENSFYNEEYSLESRGNIENYIEYNKYNSTKHNDKENKILTSSKELENKLFDNFGIEREYSIKEQNKKDSGNSWLNKSIKNLDNPFESFDYPDSYLNFKTTKSYKRTNLDICNITISSPSGSLKFCGNSTLNTEYGVQEIRLLLNEGEILFNNFEIEVLPENQIIGIVDRTVDQSVASGKGHELTKDWGTTIKEGLNLLAAQRVGYSYNPAEDPKYINLDHPIEKDIEDITL